MKLSILLLSAFALWCGCSLAASEALPSPENVEAAFDGRAGSLVVIRCPTGEIARFRPETAAKPLAPCSTFKIWNALLGLETGVVTSPDALFYRWDGVRRFIPEWNQDLTLKEAFKASCVPAFQELARKIGEERMNAWIAKIGYGDQDTSAGIDVFWLPTRGRKTLLITPEEQARLMERLATGKIPASPASLAALKEVMTVKKTPKGTLYGKTGTGGNGGNHFNLGWFVGYVESPGGTQAFACVLRGDHLTGKDARAVVETVMEKQGLL